MKEILLLITPLISDKKGLPVVLFYFRDLSPAQTQFGMREIGVLPIHQFREVIADSPDIQPGGHFLLAALLGLPWCMWVSGAFEMLVAKMTCEVALHSDLAASIAPCQRTGFSSWPFP